MVIKEKEKEKQELEDNGITVITEKIKDIKGQNGMLSSIVFQNGEEVDREAAFITPSSYATNVIGQGFTCDLDEQGLIVVDHFGRTSEKMFMQLVMLHNPHQLISFFPKQLVYKLQWLLIQVFLLKSFN